MMGFTISRDNDTGIIHCTFSGTISERDVRKANEESYVLSDPDGPNLFMTEFDNAESTLSIVEIFGLPEHWEELGFSRSNKLAIVVSEESVIYSDVKLHVLTSRSRGWMATMFNTKEYAIKWLTGT